MKKRIGIVMLAAVFIIFAYFYAHIDKNTYLYDRNKDSSTFISTGILKEDEQVSQPFVCQEEHIDGFNIKMGIIGNTEDVVLQYALVDSEDQPVYEGEIKASEIEHNKFNLLAAERISGAKDKSYRLVLKQTGADDMNGVNFFICPSDAEGIATKDNETQGTLVAKMVTHRFDLETFFVFLGFVAFIGGFMKILYKLFK